MAAYVLASVVCMPSVGASSTGAGAADEGPTLEQLIAAENQALARRYTVREPSEVAQGEKMRAIRDRIQYLEGALEEARALANLDNFKVVAIWQVGSDATAELLRNSTYRRVHRGDRVDGYEVVEMDAQAGCVRLERTTAAAPQVQGRPARKEGKGRVRRERSAGAVPAEAPVLRRLRVCIEESDRAITASRPAIPAQPAAASPVRSQVIGVPAGLPMPGAALPLPSPAVTPSAVR